MPSSKMNLIFKKNECCYLEQIKNIYNNKNNKYNLSSNNSLEPVNKPKTSII